MSVKLNGISKFYGIQKALDKISFSVESGQIVGILGPNGAGKSTMMKIITGFLHQDEGEIWVNDVPNAGNTLEGRKQIGYLPESNPLYTDLYVKEYLNFVGGMYHLDNLKTRITDIIELTGLSKEKQKKIGSLSKGYKQRVGIAQALIHDPSVLILDEPTSGLDPSQIVEIRQLIKNISTNKTVMLSTHIMQEAEAVCDRIIIINNGKIIADDSAEGIKMISSSNFRPVLVEFLQKVSPEQLKTIPGIKELKALTDFKYLIYGKNTDLRPYIFSFAVKNEYTILTMMQQESSLESAFLEMVKQS
jgi:ABC-2 type transport system ATP-binding protein